MLRCGWEIPHARKAEYLSVALALPAARSREPRALPAGHAWQPGCFLRQRPRSAEARRRHAERLPPPKDGQKPSAHAHWVTGGAAQSFLHQNYNRSSTIAIASIIWLTV